MVTLILFVLALIVATAHLFISKEPRTAERAVFLCLLWMLVLPWGVGGLIGYAYHAFNAKAAAESIGWKTSPFQFEVAMANLAIGLCGVLCYWFRNDFWTATAVVGSTYLLGDAWGHIHEMVVNNNHASNNSGVILYMDIILPIVTLVLLGVWKLQARERARNAKPEGIALPLAR